jgi:hypothetical protein
VLEQFSPIRNPAWHPPHGKHHRIHIERNAYGPQQDAAVEIDVGIEVAFDEIVILESLLFELKCHLEQRIFLLQLVKYLVDPLFENQRAGIEIFIYPMAEAHQPVVVILVLGQVQVVTDRLARCLDFFEHPNNRSIGTAMQGAPQGADPG